LLQELNEKKSIFFPSIFKLYKDETSARKEPYGFTEGQYIIVFKLTTKAVNEYAKVSN